jgi:hypothetical protein
MSSNDVKGKITKGMWVHIKVHVREAWSLEHPLMNLTFVPKLENGHFSHYTLEDHFTFNLSTGLVMPTTYVCVNAFIKYVAFY